MSDRIIICPEELLLALLRFIPDETTYLEAGGEEADD